MPSTSFSCTWRWRLSVRLGAPAVLARKSFQRCQVTQKGVTGLKLNSRISVQSEPTEHFQLQKAFVLFRLEQTAFDFLFVLVLIAACAAHVLLCRDLPGSVVRGCLVWGGCSRQRELFNGRLAFLKKKDEKTRPWHSSHRQVVL